MDGVDFPSSDGIDAGVSGDIADGPESWVSTTVGGPGTMFFEWRVSSESLYDYIELTIAAVVQSASSGTGGGSGGRGNSPCAVPAPGPRAHRRACHPAP